MKNSDNWREYQFRIVLGFIGVVAFGFFVFKDFKNSRFSASKLFISPQTKLNSKIITIDRLSSEAKITLLSGEALNVSNARNLAYRKVDISNFLNAGDVLFKELGNDTIKIVRGDSIYTFVLQKSVIIYAYPK